MESSSSILSVAICACSKKKNKLHAISTHYLLLMNFYIDKNGILVNLLPNPITVSKRS